MNEAEDKLISEEIEKGVSYSDAAYEAVRILAVHDYLFSGEDPEPKPPVGKDVVPTDSVNFMADWAAWDQRQIIRSVLNAEAYTANVLKESPYV